MARARLGLIVPPSNTTNEAEFTRYAPSGVTGFEDAVHADIDHAVDMPTPADPSLPIHARAAGPMLIDAADARDGLFVSRTDLPAPPLIADLEARFRLPVVTSNQATLWHAPRTLGLDDRLDGLGRLLSGHCSNRHPGEGRST